jgi:RHS repeat-associated protein
MWTVSGKVAQIKRLSTSTRSDLEFVYDASGNRIVKIEKPRTGTAVKTQLYWIYTYYERDAKGNVLAVYNRTFNTHGSGGYGYEDHYKLVEHDVYGSSRLGQRNGNSADDYMVLFNATLGSGSGAMFTSAAYGTGIIWGALSSLSRTLGYKEYQAANHLGNVQEVFSDKRIPTCGGDGLTVAYYQPNVISSTDYYAFGAQMPGRNFATSIGYRYGFNGMEKDPEVYNSNGNSYTTEFRQYDPRLGRWLTPDPVTQPWQSCYSSFNNNPILYTDEFGLYGSERRAERMRKRAEKAGLDPGEVYKSGKDWGFNTTEGKGTGFNTSGRYFGTSWESVKNFFKDVNPVSDVEVYASAVIKNTVDKGGVKVVMPYFGGQMSYSIKNGGDARQIDITNSYINLNTSKLPNVDVRFYPLSGLGGKKGTGDWAPGMRTLVTFYGGVVVVPVGDIPVPIGTWKVQGDFQVNSSNVTIGGRGVFETVKLGTMSLEVSGGAKAKLKMPDIFKND